VPGFSISPWWHVLSLLASYTTSSWPASPGCSWRGCTSFLTIGNLKVMNYTTASRFKKRFMYPFGYGFPAWWWLFLQYSTQMAMELPD
ncbi:unnamed protein product, partial [Natator depressus]